MALLFPAPWTPLHKNPCFFSETVNYSHPHFPHLLATHLSCPQCPPRPQSVLLAPPLSHFHHYASCRTTHALPWILQCGTSLRRTRSQMDPCLKFLGHCFSVRNFKGNDQL